MTALVETPVVTVDIMANIRQASTLDGEIPPVGSTEVPEVSGGIRTTQPNITTEDNTTGNLTDDPFKLASEYAYTPRKLKVFTIGAGFSGLLMAHKFQHRFPEMRDIVDHTIFEALHDVGGTWLVNNYPGVQCDVPGHIYVGSPRRLVTFFKRA